MKSHIVAVADLDCHRLSERCFYAKPKLLLYMVLILSLALFAVNVVLFQFPDIPLIEVTKDYLVLYQTREEAFLMYWDELYRWSYERDWEQDQIRFVLSDDTIQMVSFYSKKKIQVYLDKYAPKKEGKS